MTATTSPRLLTRLLLLFLCSLFLLLRLRHTTDQVLKELDLRPLLRLGCALVRIWTLLKRRRQVALALTALLVQRLETSECSLALQQTLDEIVVVSFQPVDLIARELELRHQLLVFEGGVGGRQAGMRGHGVLRGCNWWRQLRRLVDVLTDRATAVGTIVGMRLGRCR